MAVPTDISGLIAWYPPSTILTSGGRVTGWRNAGPGTNASGVSLDLEYNIHMASDLTVNAYRGFYRTDLGYCGQPYVYLDQFAVEANPPNTGLVAHPFLFYGNGTGPKESWKTVPNWARPSGYHWFAVARPDKIEHLATDNAIFGNVVGPTLYFANSSGSACEVVGAENTGTGTGTRTEIVKPAEIGRWMVLEICHQGSTFSFAVDGGAFTTAPVGSTVTSGVTGVGPAYGPIVGIEDSAVPFDQLSVREIICYDHALSPADRAAVLAYLLCPGGGLAPPDIAPDCLRFWAHPGTIVESGGLVPRWNNAAGTTNEEGISMDVWWPYGGNHPPEYRTGGPSGGPYVSFDQFSYVIDPDNPGDTDPLRALDSFLYTYYAGTPTEHHFWGIVPNYASGPECDWFAVARLDRIDLHDDGAGLEAFEAAIVFGNFGFALYFTRDDSGRYFACASSTDVDSLTTTVQHEIVTGQWYRLELRHEGGTLTLAVDCVDVDSAPAGDSVSGSDTSGAGATMEVNTNADRRLLAMSVSEVICYDCALSPTERAAMCGYLGTGLPAAARGFVFAQTTG